jgi:hypothetical protein
VIVILVLLCLLVLAPPASAARTTGWGGENPFACELQQAGFEATAPGGDPAADPYCVEFDKRRQNITQLGIVDFLSKEPARVAAAVDKCFYFQSDHWRGSVVQEDGSTKTYEWDGHYFFDKARGEGGAWVTNFNVNGRTEDPSRFPGIPPEYAMYMGPGTGGVRVVDGSVEGDPRCAERARREPEKIYADAARRSAGQAPSGFATAPGQCRAPTGGRVTSRSLGPVRLGDSEAQVRRSLGAPDEVRRGFLRFCASGGFLVGQRSDRSGDLGTDDEAPTVALVATRGAFAVRGVRPRARVRRRTLRGARRLARLGTTRVWELRRGSPVLIGVRRGRVRFVAVVDRRVYRSRAGVVTVLRRALST